jgi:hypothetical protein
MAAYLLELVVKVELLAQEQEAVTDQGSPPYITEQKKGGIKLN